MALAIVGRLSAPVHAEENCIKREEQSLIFEPDEPPLCPPLPSEIIPSTIGRPEDTTSLELAWCAGFMDVILLLKPVDRNDPFFISGDMYFQAAMAHRDRPSLAELQEWRRASLEKNAVSIREGIRIGSDGPVHGFAMCNADYSQATGYW